MCCELCDRSHVSMMRCQKCGDNWCKDCGRQSYIHNDTTVNGIDNINTCLPQTDRVLCGKCVIDLNICVIDPDSDRRVPAKILFKLANAERRLEKVEKARCNETDKLKELLDRVLDAARSSQELSDNLLKQRDAEIERLCSQVREGATGILSLVS